MLLVRQPKMMILLDFDVKHGPYIEHSNCNEKRIDDLCLVPA